MVAKVATDAAMANVDAELFSSESSRVGSCWRISGSLTGPWSHGASALSMRLLEFSGSEKRTGPKLISMSVLARVLLPFL